MQLLLQIRDPSGRRGIHIVFFRNAVWIHLCVFPEQDRNKPAVLFSVFRDRAYRQADILSPGGTVHRDPRISHRDMLAAAAVQRSGSRQA